MVRLSGSIDYAHRFLQLGFLAALVQFLTHKVKPRMTKTITDPSIAGEAGGMPASCPMIVPPTFRAPKRIDAKMMPIGCRWPGRVDPDAGCTTSGVEALHQHVLGAVDLDKAAQRRQGAAEKAAT